MKKITVLLALIICSLSYGQTDIINFEITSQFNQTFSSSNGDRIDYSFDIRGTYGYGEIKLWIYYETINNDNLINYSRWNREGDNFLEFNNYTTIDWWGMVVPKFNPNFMPFTFNTNPGKTFYLVTEHQGISQTYSYTIPLSDYDGDGVPDIQDDCPYVFGWPQFNGCTSYAQIDTDGDGVPDLFDQCPYQWGIRAWSGCPYPPSNISNSQRNTNNKELEKENFTDTPGSVNVKIYNLYSTSEPLLSRTLSNLNEINKFNLEPGVYIVHINDNYAYKFVKR